MQALIRLMRCEVSLIQQTPLTDLILKVTQRSYKPLTDLTDLTVKNKLSFMQLSPNVLVNSKPASFA